MVAMRARALAAPFLLALLAACSVRNAACGTPAQQASREAAGPAAAATSSGGEPAKIRVVFLGDSVTAGLGLLTAEAYPALIQEKFTAEGYREIEVVNAGVSGETTAGGKRRLEALLDREVKILVIALGGNDALRALTPSDTKANLAAIIDAAEAKSVSVLLVGMQAPPNLGDDYPRQFSAVFGELAIAYKDSIQYLPFLLEGVGGHPELNQADGIHPTAEGQRIIADLLYPKLRILADQALGGRRGGE